MAVSERCSCGAEFTSDDDNAIDLWREWRSNHICPDAPDHPPVNTSAQVEQVLGFQAKGLTLPAEEKE